MTLTELRYIVAVADERNFSRAAERSFVSQPSLSASVRKLEDELGIRIFERGAGEVLLTEAGEQVVAQARRVLDEAARVKAVAKEKRDPLDGVLRLGVIHTVAPYLLPELVQGLRTAAPAMPLDIEENQTAVLEQLLRAGEIDCAILALPFAAAGVETTPLYDEDFQVIMPSRHPWARRRSIRAGELATQNLLLLSMGHCFRDQVLQACQEFSRPAPPGRQGNSLETLRSMVASGIGISVLPATALTPRRATPLVKVVPFAEPRPTRRIVVATRSGFPRGGAIRVIRDVVAGADLPVSPSTEA
jgi:LysR family hydrogen peroxide-inducible transcriptional activator